MDRLLLIGGGAWAGRVVARPLCGRNGQTILVALLLFVVPK